MSEREEVPFAFRFIKLLFASTLKIFYNTVEVRGTVPPPNQSVILCPNHGNSLTDAVTVVSQTPRMVRLTAKDTLWKLPFWRHIVDGVGTIPLQRRVEHGSNADNSKAKKTLIDSLLNGSCVCLFPEGLSRYQSGMAPLKAGVGSIAIDVLKAAKEEGKEDFKLTIVACGITYTHREKFRSDVCVIYETVASLTLSDLVSLTEGEDGERKGARKIVEEVGRVLSENVISGPDWPIVKAAFTASRLYAPFGTRLDLSQSVRLTQSFVKILSLSTMDNIEERNLKRSPSDPDLIMPKGGYPPHTKEISKLLLAKLSGYENELDEVGLSDSFIQNEPKGLLYELVAMLIRLIWFLFLGILTVPGLVVLSPALMGGKILELKIIGENTGIKGVRNLDEVAQYKLAVCGVLGPPLVFFGSMYIQKFVIPEYPLIFSFFATSLWLWLTVRWIEDGVSSATALRKHFQLIRNRNRVEQLRSLRNELIQLVNAAAKEHNVPSPLQLLQMASADSAKRQSLLSYFSLRGRRRKEWGECAHYGQTPIDYPQYVHMKTESKKTKRL